MNHDQDSHVINYYNNNVDQPCEPWALLPEQVKRQWRGYYANDACPQAASNPEYKEPEVDEATVWPAKQYKYPTFNDELGMFNIPSALKENPNLAAVAMHNFAGHICGTPEQVSDFMMPRNQFDDRVACFRRRGLLRQGATIGDSVQTFCQLSNQEKESWRECYRMSLQYRMDYAQAADATDMKNVHVDTIPIRFTDSPRQTCETLNNHTLVKQPQKDGSVIVTIVNKDKIIKLRVHLTGPMVEMSDEIITAQLTDARIWPETKPYKECINQIGRILYCLGQDSGSHDFNHESLIRDFQTIMDSRSALLKEQGKEDSIATISEVKAFHNKTLGLDNDSRWNMLRVLERNAWTKYYIEMQDREIDISQIAGEIKPCYCKGTARDYNLNCELRQWLAGSNDPHFYAPIQLTEENQKALPAFLLEEATKHMEECPDEYPAPTDRDIFLNDLSRVLNAILDLLAEKNLKYGDSALNPAQIFSSCDPIELINVRIDDKLARIKNAKGNDDEDPEWDLLGYLVLKRIAIKRAEE